MESTRHPIWEKPWGYIEGTIISLGIAFSGLMLQVSGFPLRPEYFAYPFNLIIGLLFVAGLIVSYIIFRKKSTVAFLSGVYAAIPAITNVLACIVVMGIVPQMDVELQPHNYFSLLGWHNVSSSWPFILLIFHLLTILGFSVLQKISTPFQTRHIGFYLNHLGVFVALLGGVLGSTDIQRVMMTVQEGNVEWRALDKNKNYQELELAIQLDTFKIEEYNPKIVMIDNKEGKVLPLDKPESFMLNGVGDKIKLAEYSLEVLQYIPDAGRVQDADAVNYAPFHLKGAASAAKIRVQSSSLPKAIEGWISNGSFLFPYQVLYLNGSHSVAMTPQEVKKYTSYVTVFTKEGKTENGVIEVNKPYHIENWNIYQYSYDESMGKYSDTSTFELVRDPWLSVVYIGFFMMMAGALFLFITGPKKMNQ